MPTEQQAGAEARHPADEFIQAQCDQLLQHIDYDALAEQIDMSAWGLLELYHWGMNRDDSPLDGLQTVIAYALLEYRKQKDALTAALQERDEARERILNMSRIQVSTYVLPDEDQVVMLYNKFGGMLPRFGQLKAANSEDPYWLVDNLPYDLCNFSHWSRIPGYPPAPSTPTKP